MYTRAHDIVYTNVASVTCIVIVSEQQSALFTAQLKCMAAKLGFIWEANKDDTVIISILAFGDNIKGKK